MTTKKPAGAKAPATCEAEARMLAIDGASQIGAYLARMRDNYAADRSIGAEKAYLWHEECVVYLLENGVAPAEVAAANTLPGDTWRAFQVFEAWLLATRGVVTFDQAYEVATRKAPQPLDMFLMIAIANAFGKAERWLNATEEMLAQKRGIAKKPRGAAKGVTSEAVALWMKEAGSIKHEVLVADAAAHFGVGVSTIQRRMRDARKKNLMS